MAVVFLAGCRLDGRDGGTVSLVVKCDGCSRTSFGESRPKDWLRADVRNGHGTKFAVGDFCSANCLARFLADDQLDRIIKRGEEKP